MEYTEAVIKEAEEVAKKYMPLAYNNSRVNTDLSSYRVNVEYSYKCAIQDRQSVLEEQHQNYKNSKLSDYSLYYTKERIQSLTQQINYLKSKI